MKKKLKPLNKIVVGVYYAGWEQYRLILCKRDGAEFFWCQEKGKINKIEINAEATEWKEIVNMLLHEVFEALLLQRSRYYPSNDTSNRSTQYFFAFDHAELTRICAAAGEYVSGCYSDLEKAWVKWHRSKGRTVRKA
jgi:hypothetical protein